MLLAALACCTLALLPGAAHASAAAAAGDSGLLAVALSWILHLDKHLSALVAQYGVRTYALLFAIVFAETGLVVTPFLPGDSLLFAAGALAALGALSLPLLLGLLFVAAVLGDSLNYAAGKWLGARAFSQYARVFKPEYLAKTQAFFEKYGAKTIVLARFVPIVRTFAPFVAGVGAMRYSTFAFYNVAGAAVWVSSLTLAGYALGNVPAVRNNFSLVTVAIILVSVLPLAVELWMAKHESK